MNQIKSKESELIKYKTASKVVLAPSSTIQIAKPKPQASHPQPLKILSLITPTETQIITNEVKENKELQLKSISPRTKDFKEEESKTIANSTKYCIHELHRISTKYCINLFKNNKK